MKDEEVRTISAWALLVLESNMFLQDCPTEALLGLPTPASHHHGLLVDSLLCLMQLRRMQEMLQKMQQQMQDQ